MYIWEYKNYRTIAFGDVESSSSSICLYLHTCVRLHVFMYVYDFFSFPFLFFSYTRRFLSTILRKHVRILLANDITYNPHFCIVHFIDTRNRIDRYTMYLCMYICMLYVCIYLCIHIHKHPFSKALAYYSR